MVFMTSDLRVRGRVPCDTHRRTRLYSLVGASDWRTPRLCEERCVGMLVSAHHRAGRANGASQVVDIRERASHICFTAHIRVRWPGTQEPLCAYTPPSTPPCPCACPRPTMPYTPEASRYHRGR